MNKPAVLVLSGLLFILGGNVQAGFFDDLKKLGEKAAETVNEVGKSVDDALTEDEKKQQPAQPSDTQEKPSDTIVTTVVSPAPSKADVKKAQSLLNTLGYDAGTADGLMGKKTRSAIQSYQQKIGVVQDGVVSTLLLNNLEASASQVETKPVKTQTAASSSVASPEKPVTEKVASNSQTDIKWADKTVEDGFTVLSGEEFSYQVTEHGLGSTRLSVVLNFSVYSNITVGWFPRKERGVRNAQIQSKSLRQEDCQRESDKSVIVMQFTGFELKLYPNSFHKFGQYSVCKLESRDPLGPELVQAYKVSEKVDIFIDLPGYEGATQGKYRIRNSAFLPKASETVVVEPAPQPKPQPVSKPVPEEIASDPVYQACNKDRQLKLHYDCQCFAQKAPPVRSKMDVERAERNKLWLKQEKTNLARLKKQMAEYLSQENLDKYKIAAFERNIKHATEQIFELENPTGKSGLYNVREIMKAIADEGECKVPDGVREQYRLTCLESVHRRTPPEKNPEEFCQCVGNKVAELWTSGPGGNRSGWFVSSAVQAHQFCAKQ